MFELTPDERIKAFVRRNGAPIRKGALTPEMMRRYGTPVRFHAMLIEEVNNPLDYGRDVYCPACAKTDEQDVVTAYPLAPLIDKDPMADQGDMLSFTCLHCGFVEHHRAPRIPHAAEASTVEEMFERQRQKQMAMFQMYGMGTADRYAASKEMDALLKEAARKVSMQPDPSTARGFGQSLAEYVKKLRYL